MIDEDRYWMEQALALAALGEGSTRPNPRVGCVLVRDGRAVGHGYHRSAGGPHAEALAVAAAGDAARGSTLYVNLEPCSHFGRTGPCVELLLDVGIRRVVAAIQDPNPLVNGCGFQKLREAGVEVRVGPLAQEAEQLNAAFLCRQRSGRPLVTLKAALSLDGRLAAADGRSKWITSEASRRVAHRWRFRHDAVLVGAQTVRTDDPQLTVRLRGESAIRRRVVLSRSLDLDPEGLLFRAARTAEQQPWIYTCSHDEERRRALSSVARVVPVAEREGELDLGEVLEDLGRAGLVSVLVEGGGRTLGTFLSQGHADHAVLFVSNKLFGGRGGTPLLDLTTASDPEITWRMQPRTRIPLGAELLLTGALVPPH